MSSSSSSMSHPQARSDDLVTCQSTSKLLWLSCQVFLLPWSVQINLQVVSLTMCNLVLVHSMDRHHVDMHAVFPICTNVALCHLLG